MAADGGFRAAVAGGDFRAGKGFGAAAAAAGPTPLSLPAQHTEVPTDDAETVSHNGMAGQSSRAGQGSDDMSHDAWQGRAGQ